MSPLAASLSGHETMRRENAMIPGQGTFHYEYAQRCLKLLDELVPKAATTGTRETFAILMSTSLLTVPLSRMKSHPLDQESEIEDKRSSYRPDYEDLSKLVFLGSDLVPNKHENNLSWRLGWIVDNIGRQTDWKDRQGCHPFNGENLIDEADIGLVLGILRNALSHGNIVYLDSSGKETVGETASLLGFISIRSKDFTRIKDRKITYKEAHYRVVFVTATDLINLLRYWVKWLKVHSQYDFGFVEFSAAAAD
jgi:hypothetical protein